MSWRRLTRFRRAAGFSAVLAGVANIAVGIGLGTPGGVVLGVGVVISGVASLVLSLHRRTMIGNPDKEPAR